MSQRLLWVMLFGWMMFVGCSHNYYMRSDEPKDETEKEKRRKEIESAFMYKIKPGYVIQIRTTNGDMHRGVFYSYMDGIVSMRIYDSFRDFELSDITGMKYDVQGGEMKTIVLGLILVIMAYIIYEFSQEEH